jgi:hypothetical protein
MNPNNVLPSTAVEYLTLITIGNPHVVFPANLKFLPNVFHSMMEPFMSQSSQTSTSPLLPAPLRPAYSELPENPIGSVRANFPVYWPRGGSDTVYKNNFPKSRVVFRVLVEMFTEPGDTVIEAFAGSVSALWGCLVTGRSLVAMDLDEDQVANYGNRFQADLDLSLIHI